MLQETLHNILLLNWNTYLFRDLIFSLGRNEVGLHCKASGQNITFTEIIIKMNFQVSEIIK